VNAERRAANAALVLGAIVASIAMAPARSSQSHCEVPFEQAFDAGSGFTTEVACGVTHGGAELRGPARLLFGQRLDLNRASSWALESLPSIGPSRADAIVRARSEKPFESLADLARVPGIGRKTCEGLDGWVTVAGAGVDSEPEGSSGGGAQWTGR
jgi:DNA uptake protein ComE-like DNA-binding protein